MTETLPKFHVGAGTAEVITGLVKHSAHVKALRVFQYKHPALLQDRLSFDEAEMKIVINGLELRAATKMPFWDSILGSCFGAANGYTRLVEAAGFHQTHRTSFIRISRDEVLLQRLTSLEADDVEFAWSLFSAVELEHEAEVHFPMMDFHCPESERNDGLVDSVCKQLFSGTVYVFSSGKSYHAIGSVLLGDSGLRQFLAHALLFSPIIDGRYVAHQLLEGGCALRLTSSKGKPQAPRLKFVLDHLSS